MNTFFDQYTGLYFYSALFQADVALLGFFGVFIVFRLQQLATDIQLKMQRVAETKNDFFRSLSKSILVKEESLKEPLEAIQELDKARVDLAMKERDELISERRKIIKAARSPLIWTITIPVASPILLLLANWLHKEHPRGEGTVFLLIVILHCFVLWKTVAFAYEAMKPLGAETTLQPSGPSESHVSYKSDT